jgi:cytochrome oxidase Cu insertion factor (SCO1/SenC/PrrC family)
MATAGNETVLDKLNVVLKEMGALCYRETTDRNGTLKFYSVRHTTVIVEIDNDGEFEVLAPVEKSNRFDATVAALKAL